MICTNDMAVLDRHNQLQSLPKWLLCLRACWPQDWEMQELFKPPKRLAEVSMSFAKSKEET